MFPVMNPSLRTQPSATAVENAQPNGTQLTEYKRTIRESQCRLKSVQTMRKEIEVARHQREFQRLMRGAGRD